MLSPWKSERTTMPAYLDIKVAAIKASFSRIFRHFAGEGDGWKSEGAVFLVEGRPADVDLVFKGFAEGPRSGINDKIF